MRIAARRGGAAYSRPLTSKAKESAGCLLRNRRSVGGGELSMRRNVSRT